MIKKILLKIALISTVLVALIFGLQYGKKSFFNYICNKFNDQTGYQLHIKEIDFTSFFSIILNNVKVKENNETILLIKKAEIKLDLFSFFKNIPTISSLDILDAKIIKKDSDTLETHLKYKEVFDLLKNHDQFPFSISHYTIDNLSFENDLSVSNIQGEFLNNSETLFFTIQFTYNEKNIYFISNTFASTTNSVITYNNYKSQITFNLDEEIYDLAGSFAFYDNESILAKSNFDINFENKKIQFDKFYFYNNAISFSGEITKNKNDWNGHFESLPKEKNPLLNLNFIGEWVLDCSYRTQKDSFSASLKGMNIYYENFEIENILCKTEFENVLNHIHGNISLDILKVKNNKNTYIDQLHCDTKFDLMDERQLLNFYIKNHFSEILAEGTYNLNTLTLNKLEGVFFNTPFYNSKSINLTYHEKLHLSSFSLKNDNQELLDIETTGDTFNLNFNLEKLPLFYFNEFYSQNMNGFIHLKGHVNGSSSNLSGDLSIDLKDFSFNKDLFDIPKIDASLSCSLNNSLATISGRLINFPLFLNGKIPLKILKDNIFIAIDPHEEIFLNLNSEGNIAPLFEWMAIPDLIVSGKGKVQINLSGKKENLKIYGTGFLSEGYMESFALGAQLNHVEATIAIEDEKILLTSFQGIDSEKNGKIKGNGQIEFSILKGFPSAFNFNIRNFRALNMDNARGLFDGNISIFGNKEKINIEGNLNTSRCEYSIANKIDEVAETVDVIYINQDPTEPLPTLVSDNKISEIPISVDIKIAIPEVLDINSGDLRSRWGGHIQLVGSWGKISMKGEIQLSKGYYILNGQEYQIKQGNITFGIDPEKQASIYVVGSRDINDYQIDVILQGRLSNPNIILRSNPALPQQEILSLILFGKSPSEISTFEDEQLEQSLSSLLKDASSPGILSKIQKSIGIDRIDINRLENGDKEELSIKVGKNITKDLFIGLNKGFGDEPTRVSVEAKLKNDFKVQIDAGESSKGSADKAAGQISLFWKHDY